MIKNGKEQNVVPTSREQNLACAKLEISHPMACLLFKRLQWANNMGTGADDYDELAEHFINKQGLTDYRQHGFKKVNG
jgi:hypothetical protein